MPWFPDKHIQNDAAYLAPQVNELSASLAEKGKKIAYKEKQSEGLAKLYYKLNTKQNVTGIAQGDSLTYGHDTISSDKRAADTVKTDNNVNHSFTRASVTYPEKLQTNIRSIFGNTSTIINKGYSGDFADLSYQHWTTNNNADFALVMLGTNDASNAAHIPVEKQRNVQAYIQDMRKIAERFLDWNTPVFLLTPPRTQQTEVASTANQYIEPFRKALYSLGQELGCPVIDIEEMCNGLDNTHYSDALHFNGKGYAYLANRLTSLFVGYSQKNSVYPNSVIGIRHTRDDYVLKGATITNATNSASSEEGAAKGSSLLMNIGAGQEAYISFYAETDDIVLIPVHGLITGASAKYTLDNGSEQGSVVLVQNVNRGFSDRLYPPTSVTSALPTNVAQTFDGTINVNTPNEYLHITNKGYHTIKIENGAGVGTVLFQGFLVKSYKSFYNGDTVNDNSFLPTVGATVAVGSHAYNKRVSRIKKVGNMVYHTVVLNVTFDAVIDGSVYVTLKNKPENITDLKIFVPISPTHGIFADGTQVSGAMFANNQLVYLQKVVNGVTSNLTGLDLRGKTVDLYFTAIYTSI